MTKESFDNGNRLYTLTEKELDEAVAEYLIRNDGSVTAPGTFERQSSMSNQTIFLFKPFKF